MNVYCTKCIGNLIQHKNLKCPICRRCFNNENIIHIGEKRERIVLKHKEDRLLDIIKSGESIRKILIFSSYDQSFRKICDVLNKKDISHGRLIGNQNTINSTLQKYSTNEINSTNVECITLWLWA